MEFLSFCVEKIPNAIDGVLNIWLFANTVKGGCSANVTIPVNLVILDSPPPPGNPFPAAQSNRGRTGNAPPLWYSAPISQELLPPGFCPDTPLSAHFRLLQIWSSFLWFGILVNIYQTIVIFQGIFPHQLLIIEAWSRQRRKSGSISFCRHRLRSNFARRLLSSWYQNIPIILWRDCDSLLYIELVLKKYRLEKASP